LYVRWSLAVVLSGMISGSFTASAFGSPERRMAVMIVAESDPALSDSLTEVAIARLAQRRDLRLVGTRELRPELDDVLDARPLVACVERPECLARIREATDADQLLVGEVRRVQDHFQAHVFVVNAKSGVREAERSAADATTVSDLIATIQREVAALSPPAGAGIAHASIAGQVPVSPPPALAFQAVPAGPPAMMLERKPAPQRTARWLAPFGYAAGAAAIVALSAAVVSGVEGDGTAVGDTRAEAQSDLDRRGSYADLANGLFIVGGALAVTACAALLWHWRHD
jgi:TolB-like protein